MISFTGPQYRCWSIRLSQHKSAEIQVSRWPDARCFELGCDRRRRRDHAGAEVRVTLFWREFRVAYYDHRHWDHERNAFQQDARTEDDTIQDGTFRRAFGVVLRRYEQTFKSLAEHDRGR